VNTVAEMNRLLDMGVDGIITDRPDLLKEVLVERGVWVSP
jgi:glycerophosphoryl diester phosphodiesterase